MAKSRSPMEKLKPFAVVLGLLAVVALIQWVRSEKKKTLVEEYGLESLTAAPFTASDVAKLEIAAPAEDKKKKPAKDKKKEDDKEKDPDKDGDDADEKNDEADKPNRVLLVRKGDDWRLESYFDAPGDADKIKEFLDKLKKLEGEFRSEGEAALGDYDLSEDKALRFVLTKADGTELMNLLAGKKGDYNSSFVRRMGESKVYAVDVNLRSEVGLWSEEDKKPPQSHWLNKKIATLEKDKIKKIVLNWPERKLVLEKVEVKEEKEDDEDKKDDKDKKDGDKEAGSGTAGGDADDKPKTKWELREGAMGLVYKSTATDDILSALVDFECSDVLDPKRRAEFNLNGKPKKTEAPYRAEITLEDGSKVTFQGAVGPEDDDRVLTASTHPGVLYKLGSWQFKRVFKRADDLFTLPAPSIDKDKLTRVTTKDESGVELVFVKGADGDWTMTEPETGHARKDDAIDDILSALSNLKPVDVVDEGDAAARGLNPPAKTLTYTLKDEKPRTMKFGKTPKGADGPYAILEAGKDKPRTTLIEKWSFERLFPGLMKLIDPKVFPDVDESDVVKASVSGTKDDFTVRKADGKWYFQQKGQEKPGEETTIDSWLMGVASLEAEELKAGSAPDGPTEAQIKLWTGADKPFLLNVGPRDGQKRPVWRPGRKLSFIIDDGETSGILPIVKTLIKKEKPKPKKTVKEKEEETKKEEKKGDEEKEVEKASPPEPKDKAPTEEKAGEKPPAQEPAPKTATAGEKKAAEEPANSEPAKESPAKADGKESEDKK